MTKFITALLFIMACILIGIFFFMGVKQKEKKYVITQKNQLKNLFPQSVEQINLLVETTKNQALSDLNEILAINALNRTFANTAQAYDAALLNFMIASSSISILPLLHPDEVIRQTARTAQQELSHFAIDTFGQNVEIYNMFKEYGANQAKKENLDAMQQYYLSELMKDFERSGLHLPEEKRKKVGELAKQISTLDIAFEKNINDDSKQLIVTREELAGMDDDYLAHLERTEDGKYVLKPDYPTYFPLLDQCAVANTRKKMYRLFNNRAYPQNMEVLDKIIALRDEMAGILGFESYAHLNIDNEMAKKPSRVRMFLDSLIPRAHAKAQQEIALLKTDLPPSVQLENDIFQPWDLAFTIEEYKKKHYQIDQKQIAEYFPMEKTVSGLLSVYEQFLGIRFKEEPISGLWHDQVKLVMVYQQDDAAYKNPLGYLLLDLHPRPNKYTHAAEETIIPALKKDGDEYTGAVAVVLANLQKSTQDKPALLRFDEVKTFFHEFGHALHTLLGATKLAGFSGTNVKMDFVEMPSQMLEEWLYDPEILRMITSHYKTQQPLPDELIEKIIALKNFNIGNWILKQSSYSFLSLDCYAPGRQKDVLTLTKNIFTKLTPYVIFDPENHFPASFGHLISYGARYYSYLWSKVFALDLFYHIKQHGLLNPAIGKQYVSMILEPGGSKDPNILLKDFLGREPNSDAFFKDLGI